MILLRIAWGSENDRTLSQLSEEEYKQWMFDNKEEYGVEDYEFETEAEVIAFLKGAAEATGWENFNSLVINKKLIKTNKSDNNETTDRKEA